MLDKQYWIDQLGLLPHPEGGYYKELPDSKDWVKYLRMNLKTLSEKTYVWIR